MICGGLGILQGAVLLLPPPVQEAAGGTRVVVEDGCTVMLAWEPVTVGGP